MDANFDVIIVGAGYVGCCAAYHLCTSGLRTALFDRGSWGAAASRGNFGNVQIMGMEMEKSVPMITAAAKKFETLQEELDWEVGFYRIGGLLLTAEEERWQYLQRRLRVVRSVGVEAELIPAERLREIEPLLNPEGLIGGFYHAGEGRVDPFQFMLGHLVRARQRGLKEYYDTEVTGFLINGGRVEGIRTTHGDFHAGKVVLCTGARTRLLGKMLDRDWDISYILGQALVTEKAPMALHCYISTASFFKQTVESIEKEKVFTNFTVSQAGHGNFLLGEAMYHADHFKDYVPYPSLGGISEAVLGYFPSLRSLRVIRSWSVPVANTGDSCPLFGPVPGLDGLILGTGFLSTIIVSPLAGETIMQLVTRGDSDLDISGFAPERNRGSVE